MKLLETENQIKEKIEKVALTKQKSQDSQSNPAKSQGPAPNRIELQKQKSNE